MSPPATHALLTRARRSVAQALAAAGRRPVLGLDFGSLFLQFRGLLSGTAAKTAAVAVGLAGAGVGGYTVEQYLAHDSHAPSPAIVVPSAPSASTASPVSLPATAPHSFPGSRGGAPQADHDTATIEHSTPASSTPTATSEPEVTPSVEGVPAGAKDDVAPPETTPAAGLPTVPAPDPVAVAPVDPPTVPLPSIPDPSTPAVTVPSATVGEVTTPEVTVPGVTVPVSDVTDTVTGLLP
jgi:hypothetical protein